MLFYLQNNYRNLNLHLLSIIIFTLLYALNHYLTNNEKKKNIQNNLLESFYFSLITQTTVGYGITLPDTKINKIINSLQLLVLILIINLK